MHEGGSDAGIADAFREMIDDVIGERTEPGQPVRLMVNGRLAALIGEPLFTESSLSGVKLVAREGRATRCEVQAKS